MDMWIFTCEVWPLKLQYVSLIALGIQKIMLWGLETLTFLMVEGFSCRANLMSIGEELRCFSVDWTVFVQRIKNVSFPQRLWRCRFSVENTQGLGILVRKSSVCLMVLSCFWCLNSSKEHLWKMQLEDSKVTLSVYQHISYEVWGCIVLSPRETWQCVLVSRCWHS